MDKIYTPYTIGGVKRLVCRTAWSRGEWRISRDDPHAGYVLDIYGTFLAGTVVTGDTPEEVIELGRKFADGPPVPQPTYAELMARKGDGW